MYEGTARERVETEYGRQQSRPPGGDRRTRERPLRRPDRIAFWAFALGVIAMIAAATSAHAGSGGTGSAPGSGGSGGCPSNPFGDSAPNPGECEGDGTTLHRL